jgi:hypothetical protein
MVAAAEGDGDEVLRRGCVERRVRLGLFSTDDLDPLASARHPRSRSRSSWTSGHRKHPIGPGVQMRGVEFHSDPDAINFRIEGPTNVSHKALHTAHRDRARTHAQCWPPCFTLPSLHVVDHAAARKSPSPRSAPGSAMPICSPPLHRRGPSSLFWPSQSPRVYNPHLLHVRSTTAMAQHYPSLDFEYPSPTTPPTLPPYHPDPPPSYYNPLPPPSYSSSTCPPRPYDQKNSILAASFPDDGISFAPAATPSSVQHPARDTGRSTSRITIAHPYARLYAKKDGSKRRKIWNHVLEKQLFSPQELSV